MNDMAQRLEGIRQDIKEAAQQWGREARLICVSKTMPAERINPLAELGQTALGENRVQEILEKVPFLDANFDIHLIGRLQSNKVKYIIDKVCLIQSVDRMSLLQEIDRQAQKRGIVMPVLLQVSPVGEPQKGGVSPQEIFHLTKAAAKLAGVRVEGLMCVMPNIQEEEVLVPLYRQMRTLFQYLQDEAIDGTHIKELSMGMSQDYRLALREGSTMIRVGSAIFGPRS